MKYQFNLKMQLAYGIITAILALFIVYLFTKRIDWITTAIVGIANFFISGYYNNKQ